MRNLRNGELTTNCSVRRSDEGLGAYGKSVANGIAYDPDGGRLFVTGKNWPRLFEIRLLN
jgi:glutamine cyclotransferase